MQVSISLCRWIKLWNRESIMKTGPGNYTSLLSPGQFKMAYIILYCESPHALHPISQRIPQHCLWRQHPHRKPLYNYNSKRQHCCPTHTAPGLWCLAWVGGGWRKGVGVEGWGVGICVRAAGTDYSKKKADRAWRYNVLFNSWIAWILHSIAWSFKWSYHKMIK